MNPTELPQEKIDLSKLPFSQSNKVPSDDCLIFLSGQIGLKDGKLVEGGIKAETRQAIKNVETLLAENEDLELDDVVDVTVFLADMNDYTAMNEAYAKAFKRIKCKPTRTCVGVNALPLNARIEIKIIAEDY